MQLPQSPSKGERKMHDHQTAANRTISAVVAVFGAAAMVLLGSAAHAATNFIYGNSATGGNPQNLYEMDPNTGTVVKTCTMNKGNGRGIVVVGTSVYYTVANSNSVFKTDITTCADMGVAFSVVGAAGLSTMAYDGTNFWIGDYSGTNQAYNISPSGT